MIQRLGNLLTTILVVLFVLTPFAHACEGCVNFDAISTGQNVKMVQAGFSWSVLFMLGVPMVLAAWMFRVMIKACQQADERNRAQAPKGPGASSWFVANIQDGLSAASFAKASATLAKISFFYKPQTNKPVQPRSV